MASLRAKMDVSTFIRVCNPPKSIRFHDNFAALYHRSGERAGGGGREGEREQTRGKRTQIHDGLIKFK